MNGFNAMTTFTRSPYLFRDVPPAALFEHGGTLYTRRGSSRIARQLDGARKPARFNPFDVVNMSEGEARGAERARVFYLQHGHGTAGPFRTESAPAREDWRPQKRRGTVTACRFMVRYAGRWRRLYSDHRPGLAVPHFIMASGERIAVSGVSP